MATTQKNISSLSKSGKEVVHDALDSVKDQLSHIYDDKKHHILEAIKHAAERIIKKIEKNGSSSSLKRVTKRAIRKAGKELKTTVAPKRRVVKKVVKKVVAEATKAAVKKKAPARKKK